MGKNIIDRDKWQDILLRFTDVLKISVLLVDGDGHFVSSTSKKRYGWPFFERVCLNLENQENKTNLFNKFQKVDNYLEFKCESGLQGFALPISLGEDTVFAYLVIGPVILNRKEERSFYENLAKELNFSPVELMDTINEVRVVSNITMKSILDLLSEVAKDVIELNLERKKLNQIVKKRDDLPDEFRREAQDIYSTIHLDELLITLLDLALKLTNTECGSIMVIDEKKDELTIRVSRGIDEKRVQKSRVKIGEGIAGLAAKENSSFVIHGTTGENRMQPLLNRPEIKHSIIMPLSKKKKVFGVLNLHTKSESKGIDEGLGNLKYLSKLISAAFQSI